MNVRALALFAALGLAVSTAGAIDPRAHSDSSTKQFSIFCEDVPLRMRVVSFAEEVKQEVLRLLDDEPLSWKGPIVITLEPASGARPEEPAARVRLIESLPGFKVAIEVKIGDDPTEVNLQRQIVRALYLEYAYREAGVQGGMVFREAPWWIIEGTIQVMRERQGGANAALFQRLIDTNKLPPIDDFLREQPEQLGATVLAVDQALAGCLVQLLAAQPGGRASLGRFIRAWPKSNGDAVALLKSEFPTLVAGQGTLQKWWTLSLARFAATERFQGLSAEATEKELAPLLAIELATGKDKAKKTFALGDYAQYLKLPGSRLALVERQTLLVALSTRANALYRPVLGEYEEICALLARGKTRGMRARLDRVGEYRASVLRRVAEIADYLNWYEGTQMGVRSNAFDGYLKTANEISDLDRVRRDPIARYLDAIQKEY